MLDHIINKDKLRKSEDAFSKAFERPLRDFWTDNIFGFDVVKFDEWLQVPKDMSTSDFIDKHYGKGSRELVEKLL